jgi:hypothetical protein
MNRMNDLIAQLEDATIPSETLDAAIMMAVTDIGLHQHEGEWWYDSAIGTGKVRVPRYTSSIDDALILVPKSTETHHYGATVWVMPNGRGHARIWVQIKDDAAEGGWALGVVSGNSGLPANIGATPAIAICIAALKAAK